MLVRFETRPGAPYIPHCEDFDLSVGEDPQQETKNLWAVVTDGLGASQAYMVTQDSSLLLMNLDPRARPLDLWCMYEMNNFRSPHFVFLREHFSRQCEGVEGFDSLVTLVRPHSLYVETPTFSRFGSMAMSTEIAREMGEVTDQFQRLSEELAITIPDSLGGIC